MPKYPVAITLEHCNCADKLWCMHSTPISASRLIFNVRHVLNSNVAQLLFASIAHTSFSTHQLPNRLLRTFQMLIKLIDLLLTKIYATRHKYVLAEWTLNSCRINLLSQSKGIRSRLMQLIYPSASFMNGT